jgi:cytidine deaminase
MMESPLQSVPLGEVPQDLLEAAWWVAANAYVPYSRFHVGAALRDAEGRMHVGANVENASYGLARCAEQTAVQTMVAQGGRRILEVVVVTDADPPASPCGACRQVLFEFGPEARIYLVNRVAARRTSVAALLPAGFSLDPATLPMP